MLVPPQCNHYDDTMPTINVRDVPPEVADWLKREAAARDQSVTAFVRSLLKDRYALRVRGGKNGTEEGAA